MKVILLDKVQGVGNRGDVIDVKEGYAKNYLFRKNLAKLASDSAAKNIKEQADALQAKKLKDLKELEGKVASLAGKTFVFKKKINPKGQLFASISDEDVKKMVAGEIGIRPLKVEGVPVKEKGRFGVELEFALRNKVSVVLEVIEG